MNPKIILFLRHPILINRFVYLDIWGIIHFLSAGMLTFLITKNYGKTTFKFHAKSFYVAMTTLMAYEFIEPHLPYFITESALNISYDLIWGAVGITTALFIRQIILRKMIKNLSYERG